MNDNSLFLPSRKKKILIIGDLMLDSYVSGTVERISPEAPVPVLAMRDTRNVLGGAANVARNLAVWKADTRLYGIVGDDEKGDEMRAIIKKCGIYFDSNFISKRCHTISKIRIIASNQHICRVDMEDSKAAYEPSPRMVQTVLEQIDKCDAVIVSDYAKGFITESFLQSVIDKCNSAGKVFALDPKPRRCLNFKNPFLLKPNKKEALELADITLSDPREKFPLEEVCRRIYKKYFPKNLVITLGEDGIALSHKGRLTEILPAQKVSVYDVSGAGDTVISMLAFAVVSGLSLEDAAILAMKAAAVVVGKFGTAQAEISEICAQRGN